MLRSLDNICVKRWDSVWASRGAELCSTRQMECYTAKESAFPAPQLQRADFKAMKIENRKPILRRAWSPSTEQQDLRHSRRSFRKFAKCRIPAPVILSKLLIDRFRRFVSPALTPPLQRSIPSRKHPKKLPRPLPSPETLHLLTELLLGNMGTNNIGPQNFW